MNKVQRKIGSKIGPIYLVASSEALYGVLWEKEPGITPEPQNAPQRALLDKTERQITEYLAGERKVFDVPLALEGTDFQKRVWERLSKIPYGETRAYKDIAKELKDPNASRAVGTANGRNPISLIIPCHRVIASDGTLGGYAGGLSIKARLLSLEQAEKRK
ncbi:MAG: methylated-DNA--[protein]-cysteine S-methyltransferase [Bdellovibrionales bacterium]|jgi:methylated-DNA-[protein]-cysteine S-methyltransferase|nr:methylated-DNA--[protein]-cysteine S-methyltransferase [Bdellovibrionales bacterium]